MKGGGEDGERSGKKTPTALKKGPWTAEEDAVLVEYVSRHGEGNWNSVQKRAGLARCGKSCRLRWANHLRPNLKKGHFTPEEEAAILRLHAQMGNKWARMASLLPGRTDNEIKNYWNTRVKRRQRAGLPLYPPPPESVNVPRQHRVAVRGRGTLLHHRNAAAPPMAMPFFVANAVGGMAPPRTVAPLEYGLMPVLPSLMTLPTTDHPSSQFLGETTPEGGGSGLLDMLLQQVEGEQQEVLQLLDQSVMVKLGNSDSSTETGNGSSTATINADATDDPTNQAAHHDDISKLFDMIPAPTMPALPDWYDDSGGEICKGPQYSVETSNTDRLGPSSGSVAGQIEQEWSIVSFPWNNMPEIC